MASMACNLTSDFKFISQHPSDFTTWLADALFQNTKQLTIRCSMQIEDLDPQLTYAAVDLVCELRQALTAALPGSTLSWCSDMPPSADPGYNFTRLGSCVDYFVM
eukprot:SAG31_NODE_1331_length_8748_cov_5.583189_7_plen_105_part_00